MIVNRDTTPRPVDFDFLESVRVTDYEVKNQLGAADKRTAELTVVISYYHTDYGTVKTITDHQTWRYNENANGWFLDGNLPDFKGGLARRR